MQCSHYLPSPLPEDISLPCVVYCHGNRYANFYGYCYHCKRFYTVYSHKDPFWTFFFFFQNDTLIPFFSFHMYVHVQWCSGCRADANEAAVILLPSNITVFTLDFSGSGLSDGDYVSLGWHEVSYLFMHVFICLLISGY